MTKIEARTVLWYMVFVGFAINYMIRINVNIAIVQMVLAKPKSGQFLISVENGSDAVENLTATVILTEDTRGWSLEKQFMDLFKISYDSNGFDWDEKMQGLVLGSFYWAHWITQIPGGILARKYGTKLIFGLSNAIACWLCILMPIASYFDYKYLIFLRVAQGLIVGLAWPAMHHMTAQWIPPNERARFVTAYLGSSVGIAVFYPLFGYVMSCSSWEWVFHICGFIGTVWYLGWLYFVYDTPACHPRISTTELRMIEKSLGASVQKKYTGPTPWKDILTSSPMWMNVIAQWGGIWGLFTLMTQAPTYFKNVHHWDMRTLGVISGLPHIMRMGFALVFSMFGDYLLKTDKMSRTNVRKLATFICCIVKGFLVLGLAYYGESPISAVTFITLATMVHGSVSSGPLASLVDIAPNFAGVVLGISGLIALLPGFISPIIVGYIGNKTIDNWKHIFQICSGMLISSGILYVIFCDSTEQHWNNPAHKEEKDAEKELQPLQKEELSVTFKEKESER